MNTFKSSALKVLQQVGKPLHVKEITKIALANKLLQTTAGVPEHSMHSRLSTDVKNKGAKSVFKRVAPATFALNSSREGELIKSKVKVNPKKSSIESGYTGKAGEHLVCSELLFRGFNASIMSVDVGMDIVAVKNNRLLTIQVKTSNLHKRGEVYVFDVRKVSFERHDAGNNFYVFVLHNNNMNHFIILPYHEMQKKVEEKVIGVINKGKSYRVRIIERDGLFHIGNQKHRIDYYLNNWKVIR